MGETPTCPVCGTVTWRAKGAHAATGRPAVGSDYIGLAFVIALTILTIGYAIAVAVYLI
jgi:hypothetical protein